MVNANGNPWPYIGELFVKQGRLTRAQLSDALAEQERSGARLGEILVARGQISRVDLASAIGAQWSWDPNAPAPEEPIVEVAPAVALEAGRDAEVDHEPNTLLAEISIAQQAPASTSPISEQYERSIPATPVAAAGGQLETRVAALEDAARLIADLQSRVRAAYGQLASAEARLGAIEPLVSQLAQANATLNSKLAAQAHEIEALRTQSSKQQAQLITAARALLS